MKRRSSRILPANAALVAVGLIDLLTTLIWLRAGIAVEVNPIMAAVLRCGLSAFIGLKLTTLATYLTVMEWYRRRRSAAFARSVARITLASYLAIYAISFAYVNGAIFLG
ncbi:MAG: DUF5658 family protein [Armatimonadetes bacterium]|nr:DUF5658 family protein [Armatimonadota bacterium]